MLKNKKIGFIGGGNMAEAMIKGLLSASFIEAKNVFVSEPSEAKRDTLHAEYKIKVSADNRELVKKCDIIILAVKPQIVQKVLRDIASLVGRDKLVISIAAGVPIAIMDDVLRGGKNKKFSIVRTMPNTPALVQEGVTAIASGEHVRKIDVKIAHRIFEAVGRTVDVEEDQLDAVTGLSGSGPAYIFMLIEALSDAGVKMGLSREVANTLTIQTVLGSAKLARESGKHPGELKDMVTSPAGTTISGLHALEEGSFHTTLMNAVEDATLRSRELGQIALNKNTTKRGAK
ncbi:MAG TPA: pyrroline-5-carboxylate reductase [Nitrospinaceae bacterium]|nr:pyrroline-5-carboxylate reductase [Nitrospinaceae bacterium]HBP11047.1 pyrroline-5-carboxylate reductase [Nitrospina sp.]HCK68303.1 pyrroline-5-carboxylate reductase [Nitrospina sp.]HIE79822.1 pyrroline-5-carboxylate reductase [Nitrospinaceae bacterium]